VLTEESVAGEERRVELSTVRAFGAARKFVGSSRQGRRGSGKRQNGLVGVRRSSWREESGNGGARLGGLLGMELTAEMVMAVAFTHCLGSNG